MSARRKDAWTGEEDDAVRTHSPRQAALLTGRSVAAVNRRRMTLGVANPLRRAFVLWDIIRQLEDLRTLDHRIGDAETILRTVASDIAAAKARTRQREE